jgi:hypothetical protein
VLPKCQINIEKHVFYGLFASKFLNIWFRLLALILYSYVRPNFLQFTICWTDKKESYLEVGNTEKPHLSPPTPVCDFLTEDSKQGAGTFKPSFKFGRRFFLD